MATDQSEYQYKVYSNITRTHGNQIQLEEEYRDNITHDIWSHEPGQHDSISACILCIKTKLILDYVLLMRYQIVDFQPYKLGCDHLEFTQNELASGCDINIISSLVGN